MIPKRATIYIGTAFAMIIAAEPALANAGTAFFFVRAMHLVLGNFFIGVIEAGLLLIGCRLILGPQHRIRWWKVLAASGIMVLANYASGMCGIFVHPPFLEVIQGPVALYSVRGIVAWSVLWAYLMTLIVEFPFAVAVVALTGIRLSIVFRALGLHLILQTLTNLLVLYFLLSVMSLPDLKQIDPTLLCRHGTPGSIIYLAPDGVSVRKIRLDGSGQEILREFPASEAIDRLLLEQGEKSGSVAVVGYRKGSKNYVPLSLEFFPPPAYTDDETYLHTELQTLDLRPESERSVIPEWVYGLGLQFFDADAQKREAIIVDAPTGGLYELASGASVALPGDVFLFQIGPEIALYSWKEKKLAVLVSGTDMIYVPD